MIEKLKTWFLKNWLLVVNYLVIFVSYSVVFGHKDVLLAELLLGLWIFTSAAYGMFKWFIKK